jgi:hypothetical protein
MLRLPLIEDLFVHAAFVEKLHCRQVHLKLLEKVDELFVEKRASQKTTSLERFTLLLALGIPF